MCARKWAAMRRDTARRRGGGGDHVGLIDERHELDRPPGETQRGQELERGGKVDVVVGGAVDDEERPRR